MGFCVREVCITPFVSTCLQGAIAILCGLGQSGERFLALFFFYQFFIRLCVDRGVSYVAAREQPIFNTVDVLSRRVSLIETLAVLFGRVAGFLLHPRSRYLEHP